MKTLVCKKPGELAYKERDRPVLNKNNAIIKISRIGICGTDLHAFEGSQPYFEYPRILGHELAGELVDYDGLSGFTKGEMVTFIPYFSCKKCIACRSGKPNCCVQIQVFGVHIDGGMAEYVSVPSASLLHGAGLKAEALAMVEPLAIGAHGIRRANIKKGETVLVIGAGPIGSGVMQLAHIAGAKVIAMDVNNRRLTFCSDKLKVLYTINAAGDNVRECLEEMTNGDMPQTIIDATGNRKAINNGFNYIAHGGKYILIGLQKNDICFSHPEFHKREATLMSSRNATREDFEQVIGYLRQGLIDPDMFITHRVPFHEAKEGFKKWLDPANGVIKAMIKMD